MDSKIVVKAFPASNGESFLIKCIGENVTNILVDCGFISTAKEIENELNSLRENEEKLDLIILTHIDNDHINGARHLLESYLSNHQFDLGEIWHNDYFKMLKLEECGMIDLIEENIEILKRIYQKKYPKEPNIFFEKDVGYKSANLLTEILAKEPIAQKLNKSFDFNAVFTENNSNIKIVEFNSEVTITILGPTKKILKDLLNEWNNYLKNKGFQGEITDNINIAKAFEMHYVNCRNEIRKIKESNCSSKIEIEQLLNFHDYDTDLVNRSSISFILDFYDMRLLFMGDSSPLDYEETIKCFNKTLSCNKSNFDLIKVPHHGSKKNWSTEIMNLVYASDYLISTNSTIHRHPDLESIIKIICCQKEHKCLHFNYKPRKIISFLEKYNLKRNNDYLIKYKNSVASDKGILVIPVNKEKKNE